MDVKSI